MATVFQEPSEADLLGQVIAPDQPTLSEPSARAMPDRRRQFLQSLNPILRIAANFVHQPAD